MRSLTRNSTSCSHKDSPARTFCEKLRRMAGKTRHCWPHSIPRWHKLMKRLSAFIATFASYEGLRSAPRAARATLDKVAGTFQERPIEAERKVLELVGECLWDVFSDSHEVVAPDGRVLDLGSFRASGGFLADVLNRQSGTDRYDYIDFYMGTIWVAHAPTSRRSTEWFSAASTVVGSIGSITFPGCTRSICGRSRMPWSKKRQTSPSG